MPAYRFPILIVRDAAGLHTAVLVEDDGDVAALAETRAQAVAQVRDHLEKQYKREEWRSGPDFEKPELQTLRVDVRPEYEHERRPYPCGETVAVRVPVVTGRTVAGLRVAAMPTLGIRFNYYDADDFKPLVTQYVQAALRGKTPAEVARHLMPAGVELDDVVIQVPLERAARPQSPDTEELARIADPLASRDVRGRYSRAWERDDLVALLVRTLAGERAPVLLVGESGVGKTSVLADAARRIERDGMDLPGGPGGSAAHADPDDAAPRARAARFWLTSAPRIVSGMQYLGMWQERVEGVIAELGAVSGVLCVENLLDLVRTGGSSPAGSIAAFIVPFLARGELRLVAEATPAELDAIRRLLPGLADVFRIVVVPPFGRASAVAALGAVANAHRQNAHVEFDRTMVDTVHKLFARFMPYAPFPGRSAAFVTELFERARGGPGKRTVTSADAIDLFVRRTGLPEFLLRDDLPLESATVFERLRADVIGQDAPCRAASDVVVTLKAGLNDPTRPLGVLLFCGPTGVGKTQLAQSLAGMLFGGESGSRAAGMLTEVSTPRPPANNSRLVRLDMSEYAGPDAADRFLGTAHGGPPDWIQRVRHQPFCVLLLDEIEKAAPEIFDLLLGVFDEGRLTDPWGRLTWFRSAVIVMTSNLGAGRPAAFGLSRAGATPPATYDADAMGFFRPEFFNRIDAVVTFDPLSEPTVRAITAKELGDIAAREGLDKRGIKLAWTDRLVASLAAVGFDPRYGARPLQRTIEQRVVTPLARYLVDHPDVAGRTLTLDLGEDGTAMVS